MKSGAFGSAVEVASGPLSQLEYTLSGEDTTIASGDTAITLSALGQTVETDLHDLPETSKSSAHAIRAPAPTRGSAGR